MKSISGLLEPVPFLIRYPIYHQLFYPDGSCQLQLRFFSIIEDIALVYNWINKPKILSCGHIRPYQQHMLKYYKTILDSSDSQSFMVIRDNVGVVQFDILLARTDHHTSGLTASPYDIILRYLADYRVSQTLFSHSLHLCLSHIFSFSGDFNVYIKLLPMGIINEDSFTSIGCTYEKGVADGNGTIKIFSCTRNNLKSINTEVPAE